MTSVLCSLPKHLSLFTISSWYLAAGGGLLWCSAPPHVSPPIPGGLFLQFVKSQSLRGMVQSQRRDGVGDAGKQLAFTNAVGAVKYGSHISTCARLCVHLRRHACTPPTHTIQRAHTVISLQESGALVCMCCLRVGALGGGLAWVGLCAPLTPAWQAPNCIQGPWCRFLLQTVAHTQEILMLSRTCRYWLAVFFLP